jgi:hypothetical protein
MGVGIGLSLAWTRFSCFRPRFVLFRGAVCDFTQMFAATGSKRLPRRLTNCSVFAYLKNDRKRKWKHPFAESAIWKQRLAESQSGHFATGAAAA